MTHDYGFFDECYKKFGQAEIYQKFVELFDFFPLCALIENQIFCLHGGLSRDCSNLDEIRSIDRKMEIPQDGIFLFCLFRFVLSFFFGKYTRDFVCFFMCFEFFFSFFGEYLKRKGRCVTWCGQTRAMNRGLLKVNGGADICSAKMFPNHSITRMD